MTPPNVLITDTIIDTHDHTLHPQFNDVLADVRKLIPGGILTDPMLAGIARAYNTTHCKVVDNGDHKVYNIANTDHGDIHHAQI